MENSIEFLSLALKNLEQNSPNYNLCIIDFVEVISLSLNNENIGILIEKMNELYVLIKETRNNLYYQNDLKIILTFIESRFLINLFNLELKDMSAINESINYLENFEDCYYTNDEIKNDSLFLRSSAIKIKADFSLDKFKKIELLNEVIDNLRVFRSSKFSK